MCSWATSFRRFDRQHQRRRFRATSFDRCVRKATIGATAHDARHDDKSCGKNEEIDDDVPDKGDKYVPARERGSNRIRGTEQAVNRPGLSSDLGHNPTGKDCEEAQWRRDLAGFQESAAFIDPS